MPSAMQIQETRDEPQLAKPGLGIQIVSVESRIDFISLTTAVGSGRAPDAKPFEFDVNLNESKRTEDSLTLKYSFSFGRPSAGQTCKVSGKAVVRFSQFNPARDSHTLGNDISNEMTIEIFRKNYELVYLLHEALGVEAPSPWIMQGVSLSSRSEEREETRASP